MNEYILDLDRFAEINKLKDENQLNPIVNTSRRAVPGKKIIMILLLIMSAVTLAAIYLLSAGLDNPQAEKVDKDIYEKMVNELQTERALVEQEKQRLAEHERNLKKFEAELNTKYSDYARKVQQLEEKEMEFNSKVDLRF
ncbi:MAG: hypothetical protein MUF15_05650, partial [Acidobacteria bacterium]|nr:hypothetical protein [Acidobacteriota bacterium]